LKKISILSLFYISLLINGCATFDGIKVDTLKVYDEIQKSIKNEHSKKSAKRITKDNELYKKNGIELRCFENHVFFEEALKRKLKNYKNKDSKNIKFYEELYKVQKKNNDKLMEQCLSEVNGFESSFKYLSDQLNGGKDE